MKVMLSTSATIGKSFEDLLGKIKQEREQQHNFASAMHSFQEQLLQDLETTSQSSQSYISALTTALGSSLRSMIGSLAFTSEDFQINMNDLGHVGSHPNANSNTSNSLRQDLKAISDRSSEINKSVTRIFQQILHGSSELAVLRNDELEASKALSADLQHSLRSIRDENLGKISTFMRNLHHDLVSNFTPPRVVTTDR